MVGCKRGVSYTKDVVTQESSPSFLKDGSWRKWLFFGSLLLLSLVPLYYGFSRFPKFLGDEGIYVSQAWWLIRFHKLGPYTYWYDHFPLGWLLIGLWQKLTGGPFVFGFSLISGRLLMILLAGISNIFLFKLLYKLTRSWFLSLVGSVLFAFSPLGVLFHRQVLLDNIASFWLIISLDTFFSNPRSGQKAFWSSIFLSLAILSKESVLFVLPVFYFSIFLFGQKKNRNYLILLTLVTTGFLLSLFPLLAWLKGEFFSGEGHVSFLETLVFQATRGGSLPFWDSQSDFYKKFLLWLKIDPVLIFLGFGSFLINLLFKFKDKTYFIFSLFFIFFLLFLIRGGLVLDFYLIPLLPFLVINTCLFFQLLSQEIKFIKFINRLALKIVMVGVLILLLIKQGEMLYVVDATANQLQAIEFLKHIEDKDKVIIADNFTFLDLRLDKKDNPWFKNIEWYSKAEADVDVRKKKLEDNPEKIDVMLVNNTMGFEIDSEQMPFLKEAKEGLVLSQKFEANLSDNFKNLLIDLPYVIEELTLYVKDLDNTQEVNQEDKLLEDLSLEQKIGQLLMTVPEGKELSKKEVEWLEKGLIRGFFLLEKNIENKDQLVGLIKEIEKVASASGQQLIIGVDQEGGRVSRINWVDSTSQREIKRRDQAYEIAKTRGEEVKEMGIKMNFSPVLDSLTERAFEEDEGKLGAAMVKGYLQAGIIPVAKHFPGSLGRTETDPHLSLPTITFNQNELEQDLEPFKQVIAEQIPAIMVTHTLYPEIDKNPASKSKIFLANILRDRLGFEGVVIVDDLSMGAVTNDFEVGDYAVESLLAGADLFLISSGNDLEKVRTALHEAVEQGRVNNNRLNEAVKKVWQLGN